MNDVANIILEKVIEYENSSVYSFNGKLYMKRENTNVDKFVKKIIEENHEYCVDALLFGISRTPVLLNYFNGAHFSFAPLYLSYNEFRSLILSFIEDGTQIICPNLSYIHYRNLCQCKQCMCDHRRTCTCLSEENICDTCDLPILTSKNQQCETLCECHCTTHICYECLPEPKKVKFRFIDNLYKSLTEKHICEKINKIQLDLSIGERFAILKQYILNSKREIKRI